jgi:phosphocarrier protein HPr
LYVSTPITNERDVLIAPPMKETVRLTHAKGLHARPASKFVQAASSYEASIKVETDSQSADAKSSVSVLTLNADEGDDITISADGEDAEAAVTALVALVRADFELESEA